MTDEELDLLEALWRGCMPLEKIARKLGCSKVTIQQVMARDRARFPYRHKVTPKRDRDMWAARIRAGKATPKLVAKELGVSLTTVQKWVREGGKAWSTR